jgi:hypothetical protein
VSLQIDDFDSISQRTPGSPTSVSEVAKTPRTSAGPGGPPNLTLLARAWSGAWRCRCRRPAAW